MATLDELLAPATKADVERTLLAALSAIGFPVASWHSESFLRKIVGAVATMHAAWWPGLQMLAKGGYRTLAGGEWLDLHGEDAYRCARAQSRFAVGHVWIANATGSPRTIAVGELTFEGGAGAIFTNANTDTIDAGSSASFELRAASAGSASNVASETLSMITPIAGMSFTAEPGTAWLSTQGADAETDDAYRTRLGERWAALNLTDTPSDDAYAYRAKSCDPTQITRVVVQESTPGPGSVTLWLGGPSGPIAIELAAEVLAAFEANRWRPRCVGLYIYPCVARPIALAGSVRVRAGYSAAALAAIDSALDAIERSASGGDVIDLDELRAIVRTAPGVTWSSLSAPAADVTLAASEIAAFSRTGLTVTES